MHICVLYLLTWKVNKIMMVLNYSCYILRVASVLDTDVYLQIFNI